MGIRCRAGTTTRYHFGDDDSKVAQYAWFDANAFDIGKRYAHLVGRRKPNAWGLFDMHGNVWEWCRDVYAKDLPGGMDPEVKSAGKEGVRRGGCWNLHAAYCRSACRLQIEATAANHDLGFRLILEQTGSCISQFGCRLSVPVAASQKHEFSLRELVPALW